MGGSSNQDLIKALNRLKSILFLYVIGSPLSAAPLLMIFGIAVGLPNMAVSLWSILYVLESPLPLFIGALFAIILLAVGGGIVVVVIEYSSLLPAFRALRRHDPSFTKPLILVGVGCLGPAVLLLAFLVMVGEAASGRPVSIAPLLLWVGVILLILGQIGLATGLLKLRRKHGVSKFSMAAYMFLLNIVLSLALSPVAVIVGLVGWVLTFFAAGSALKKEGSV
ncbi:MAG: hypothetical protein QXF52_04945 [Thermoproteota archaeon]